MEQYSLPPIDRDEGMDRTYIPIPGGWEIQTKGHGSSFRICNTKTHERDLITDERLHGVLTTMALETRAAYEKATAPPDAPGEVSDGYHTFNELYSHRNALFEVLMSCVPHLAWKSLKHNDGTAYESMFIAGLRLASGEVSYHLPISHWDSLDFVKTLEVAPPWDGHTSQDVIARLNEMVLG